mmetsp:Transcript_1040/g.2297  ORF Transcript_1040/g.2297 Transcript_1040/m.2297 type:complete len:125 (-) Transcript_1040:193-567(-)
MTTIDYSRDITPSSPQMAKSTPWQYSDTPSVFKQHLSNTLLAPMDVRDQISNRSSFFSQTPALFSTYKKSAPRFAELGLCGFGCLRLLTHISTAINCVAFSLLIRFHVFTVCIRPSEAGPTVER